MSGEQLDSARFGGAYQLAPIQNTNGGVISGPDTSTVASQSPDIARDWTVTIDRFFQNLGGSEPPGIEAIIEWGAGGAPQEVSIPLTPNGIVFHCVGVNVRVLFKCVAPVFVAVDFIDTAHVAVAPGTPHSTFAGVLKSATNGGGAPAAVSLTFTVPTFARRVRLRTTRSDALAPWPKPPIDVGWLIDGGVLGDTAFSGVMATPDMEMMIPSRATDIVISDPTVPAAAQFFAWVEWEYVA